MHDLIMNFFRILGFWKTNIFLMHGDFDYGIKWLCFFSYKRLKCVRLVIRGFVKL